MANAVLGGEEMKKWLLIPICFILFFSVGCSSGMRDQSNNNQQGTISTSESNPSEGSDEPIWAQPVEEHGQLFTGLNLDGIGDYDDEAYVSLYSWDHNGFDRYDAAQLVIRIRFGTGDTTAHIVQAVGSYQFYTARLFSEKKDAIVLEVNNQYANSGLVSVFVLDIYGVGEADPFPSVVERLNTTGEVPILSTDGEKLYTGSLIQGTTITDIEDKPLQGIALHSSGDGYSGPIDDREIQTIYWNGEGWTVLERSENTSSAPDTIQLNFSVQDFSNIPLGVLKESQIESIVSSEKIDDMVTYAEYIPREFNEENPEGYTYLD